MKAPGPPPTPTNLKLLRGNPGKRKLNTNEPDPEPAIPTCPSHLDKVAKREWRRVTKELFALGILWKLDRAALGGYCDAYGRWAESAKQIQQYGMIFKSPSGYPMPSPYLPILHTALDQMRAFLTEFGLSPASRSRFKVANPKQRDLFNDFLDDDDDEEAV
jgi:P27 family predicted phage terminase small subunit